MYTQATADAICKRLAEGESLRAICRSIDIPESTVRNWEMSHEQFAAQSARAREIGCHSMADEMLEIADDGTNDWMKRAESKGGGYEVNGEHIQRSRLRIDTRMRLLGKWLPKVYGDKTDVNLSASVTVEITRFADKTPK